MNRLRAFISSSSGLVPIQQGKGWVVVSVLAGLVVLLGINKAESDHDSDRIYCVDIRWNHCFDCSSNSDHPICAWVDADLAEPEAKYLYYTYASDGLCNLYIAARWYSSTPCSESVPLTATDQETSCGYSDRCADFNSTEPYRHCTTYHFNDDTWQSCLCSSTPCSESVPTPTAVLTSAAGRPTQHRLGDAYPNPFNPAMVIPLDLATDQQQVHLALYDVLGRRVRQLWGGPLRAGSHRFVWDGRDEEGKAVAAGVYIYKVEVDGQIEAKKTTKLP